MLKFQALCNSRSIAESFSCSGLAAAVSTIFTQNTYKKAGLNDPGIDMKNIWKKVVVRPDHGHYSHQIFSLHGLDSLA